MNAEAFRYQRREIDNSPLYPDCDVARTRDPCAFGTREKGCVHVRWLSEIMRCYAYIAPLHGRITALRHPTLHKGIIRWEV
jgi:hypothetical protein